VELGTIDVLLLLYAHTVERRFFFRKPLRLFACNAQGFFGQMN
jgi:hypothetical protein